MSRFNNTTKKSTKTTNHEGEEAYKLTPELELYTIAATSIMQPKFYEKGTEETTNRIKKLIKQCGPKFTAKLAVYTREKMYLRTIPLVLLVELAKTHKGTSTLGKALARTIQRPDEITETLAYYQLANKRTGTKKLNKLSKQIQKGLLKAFTKFDEYQLAKYNRKQEITLKDAMFLVHPKPRNDKEKELFKKLIDDKLEVPYTWETRLSEAGKNKESKKQVWEELIDSEKVGYMALMRNLRNILDENVSMKHIKKVCQRLSNKESVKRSKQLPFRFYSAYRELENNQNPDTQKILEALETAVKHSAQNIKGFDENIKVCIAADVSGSMQKPISERSKVELYDIGLILSMILKSRCERVITGIFGDTWKTKQYPKENILQNTSNLHRIEGEVGYSTNGYKVIQSLNENKRKVDKIMIFTDCQLWDSENRYGIRQYSTTLQKEWKKYKTENPQAKLYLFDLAGYGNTPISTNEQDVHIIAGWSDKIFEVLHNLERGEKPLQEINQIEL